jgi:hypothetical protein
MDCRAKSNKAGGQSKTYAKNLSGRNKTAAYFLNEDF